LVFAGTPYEIYQQLASRVPQNRSLPMYGCRQKFLLKKGAVNQKRLRNTGLGPTRKKGPTKLKNEETIPKKLKIKSQRAYKNMNFPKFINYKIVPIKQLVGDNIQ